MKPKHRWYAVAVFFAFMFVHQADRLMIGPLTTPIMETFGINEAQMGAVSTAALIVSALLYPVWGYLYDRYARSKLLALASLIWGVTTMLNARAPTYPAFLVTRASTGIDDSSYPGLFSMVADFFSPLQRGKIFGLLELSGPLGYLAGMMLALLLGGVIGWRNVYLITGVLGIVIAAAIFFGVKEPARGRSEPEMAGMEVIGTYRFNWKTALQLFRKRSLLVLFVQGFFGVFPWQVITFWMFRYLETERGYDSGQVLVTMGTLVVILAGGYFLGGMAGDWAFKRTPRGRTLVAGAGVLLGAVFLTLALNVPVDNPPLFLVWMALTAVFMPMAAPNVISSVYDITLPEVRSTAMSVQYFIENAGAASAPLLAGLIAVRADLKTAILVICTSTWLLCAVFFAVTSRLIPHDISVLRAQMQERAEEERAIQSA